MRPAWPVWIDGGDPDLAYHMRHVALDPPGGEEQLENLLSELCSGLLGSGRPSWRLWHVTGLAGDRDAIVLQVHHVLADGNASVALWNAIADDSPRSHPTSPTPSRVALAASAVGRGPTSWDGSRASSADSAPTSATSGRSTRPASCRSSERSSARRPGSTASPKGADGVPSRRSPCRDSERCGSRSAPPSPRSSSPYAAVPCAVTSEELGEPPSEALTATVPGARSRSGPRSTATP